MFLTLAVSALFLAAFSSPAMAAEGGKNPAAAQEGVSASSQASQDYLLFKEIKALIEKDKWKEASQKIASVNDPLYRKVFFWMYYTEPGSDASFSEIAHFATQNPDWPLQKKLALRAEDALTSTIDPYDIVVWFRENPPLTPNGMKFYLSALERLNYKNELRIVFRRWWRDTLLNADEQEYFIEHYGYYLSRAAHIDRLDKLLSNKHYTNARIIGKRLGMGYPRLVEARYALKEDKAGVDGLIAKVPDYLQDNPGLLYERVRWRRRHGFTDGAIELLNKAAEFEGALNERRWWNERHAIARELIEDKEYSKAYDLVSEAIPTEGISFAQAEFLAGWLALQFVDKPQQAFEHFERLYHNVSTPISRARGAYWAGRASEGLGHPDIAREWYRAAARHQTAFYGQLAIAALDDEFKPPQQLPPKRDVKRSRIFQEQELVKVAKLLSRHGLRSEATAFLDALSYQVDEPQEYLLLADLSRDLDRFDNAIRVAKRGLNKDIFLMDHAYPTIVSRLRDIEIEWALVHALIRQESAFNYKAQSGAGARGLMQLMPATAKETAQKLDVRHNTRWLTTDPNHNILLGSAYIERMIDSFDGSYPLAIAAYNAGPNRVRRWLREYGDPRLGEIGMIDWIELIPIYETRNYVQRVMEGLYVYRMKLRHIQKNIKPTVYTAFYPEKQ